MKKLLALLLSVLMIASCLVGCGDNAEPAQTDSAQPTEVSYQDTIVIGANADFVKPDPQNTGSIIDRCNIKLAQHCLVEYDSEKAELIPALATKWSQPDPLTWEFELREGVKFHDGTDFTAEDAVFTINRGMDSANAKSKLTSVASAEAVGDYTLKLNLKSADPDLLYKLADVVCVMLSKDAFDTMDEAEAVKIGTGPFKYTSWTQGSEVTFTAFPECWEGTPKTNNITVKYIPEASARLVALQTGEVDLILTPPETDIHYIEEDPSLTFYPFPGMNIHYVWFNLNVAPFDNKLVRQAVCYAIDRANAVAITYGGYADECVSVVHPLLPFYDANGKTYEYNVEKAKELLAEAGYPDGFTCTLYGTTSGTSKSNATIVQAALADIGITVNIESMESAPFNEGVKHGGTFDFAVDGWGGNAAGQDAALRPVFHSTGATNRCNIEDPYVDQLLDEALTAPSDAERQAKYFELQNYLMEEAVWCPLAIGSTNVAAKAALQGFVAPHGTTENYRWIYIEQ